MKWQYDVSSTLFGKLFGGFFVASSDDDVRVFFYGESVLDNESVGSVVWDHGNYGVSGFPIQSGQKFNIGSIAINSGATF